MTREAYHQELNRLYRSRRLRKIAKLPKDVYNYGWHLVSKQKRSQAWLHNRIVFWMYAYDKSHKWTIKDWQYEINDAAWEKAKQKRKERRQAKWDAITAKHNKPRPLPDIQTSWDDCTGPPMDLIREVFSADS